MLMCLWNQVHHPSIDMLIPVKEKKNISNVSSKDAYKKMNLKHFERVSEGGIQLRFICSPYTHNSHNHWPIKVQMTAAMILTQ